MEAGTLEGAEAGAGVGVQEGSGARAGLRPGLELGRACSGAGQRVEEMAGAAVGRGLGRGQRRPGAGRPWGSWGPPSVPLHLTPPSWGPCQHPPAWPVSSDSGPSGQICPNSTYPRTGTPGAHPGWRQVAGRPGPAPCKPCPTSQVASSAANPLARPRPAPSPAPSSSGEAARPSRPLALLPPLPPARCAAAGPPCSCPGLETDPRPAPSLSSAPTCRTPG